MPWEVTIRRTDGGPLGDSKTVCRQIASAIPAMQFYRDPSGAERIAAANARDIQYPDVIRQFMEQVPATRQGVLEGDGFSILLYGFETQPLMAIHAEVRGSGNPSPVLASLCRPHGWYVIDNASGQSLDLSGEAVAEWDEFQSCRDRAVTHIKASESREE